MPAAADGPQCGAELPVCHNCARSRRVCTGYHREHAFVLSEKMGRGCHPGSGSDSGSGSGPVVPLRWRAHTGPKSAGPQSAGPEPASAPTAITARRTAAPAPLSLPQEVPPCHVSADGLLSRITDLHIANSSSLFRTFGDPHDWPTHLLQLSSMTPALRTSVLALCTSHLGRQQGRPDLRRCSLELYTEGVALVRRAILNAPDNLDEQSLAACASLLMYENTECPRRNTDGYQVHYRGCLELLQMRGPVAHASGLAHATLQILRLHAVHAVFSSKQRSSFFARPEWIQLPWLGHLENKSPFDRIIDILLTLPDHFAQVYAMSAYKDPLRFLKAAWAALKECQGLRDSLRRWWQDFQAAVPGTLYQVKLSQLVTTIDSPEAGKLFPVAFHFPSLVVGQALVCYWTASMSAQVSLGLVHAALARFSHALESYGRDMLCCTCARKLGGRRTCLRHLDTALLPPSADCDAHAEARNIFQSVEFFLQNSGGGLGPASILPSLAWVKGLWGQTQQSRPKEVAWIDEVMSIIRSRRYNVAILLPT